jgi:signal transduction histidine kinase/predicted RNA-binding protein with RPS1 domain/DNA-binding response OmpR family regulator
VKKSCCHAERSEASAFIPLKKKKCRFLATLGMTGPVDFFTPSESLDGAVSVTRVKGKITRVLDYALLVRLHDGRLGKVRRREAAWAPPDSLLTSGFQVGQEIETAILGQAGNGELLDLSIRELSGNPWFDFARRHHVGDILEGVVARITPKEAFVAAEPGIDGYLPASEVPASHPDKTPIGDVVRLRDQVRAQITALNPHERTMRLSIWKMLQREYGQFLRERYSSNTETGVTLSQIASFRKAAIKLAEMRHRNRTGTAPTEKRDAHQVTVVVVDDCEEFRNSFASRLERQGYRVLKADTLPKVQQTLAVETEVGGLFVDAAIELPDDGIFWAASVKRMWPQVPIVIVSAKDIERVTDAIMSCGLEPTAVICKPVNGHELEEAIVALSSHDHHGLQRLQTAAKEHGDSLASGPNKARRDNLRESLRDLTLELGAQASALIGFDLRQGMFCLSAEVGCDAEAFEAHRCDLFWSPVANVISRRSCFVENDAKAEHKLARFEKMLGLFPFQSSAAISVPSTWSDPHGVFFFHRERNVFGPDTPMLLDKGQAILARVLDDIAIQRWVADNQTYMLVGQLEAGLFHELRNLLAPANEQSACLAELLRGGSLYLPASGQDSLAGLLRCHKELYDLVESVIGTLRQSERKVVALRSLLDDVLITISSTAKQSGVAIEKEMEDVPRTITHPQRLTQVILNICLNAISAMSGGHTGAKWLRLALRYAPQDAELPIRIEISDTGPGIHASESSRIFEPGFTTKTGGTGLGLSISQGLVESLGGKLSLTRACRFGGATFLVQLPLQAQTGGVQ